MKTGGTVEDFLAELRAKGIAYTVKGTNAAALPFDPMPAAVNEGRGDSPKPKTKKAKTKKADLLPSFQRGPVWVVGVETRSESNGREWRERQHRTVAARRAVCSLFGRTMGAVLPFAEHYHRGGALSIDFTRLAPHKLDGGNVANALKAVEDAVALFIGADDGDERWQATYQQETNPKMGVRIEFNKGG